MSNRFPAREHFSSGAADYQRRAFGASAGLSMLEEWERENILRALGPVSGPGLDAGAGTGRMSKALRETGATVVALDVTPEMLSEATASVPDLPALIGEVGGSLPFRNHAFDFVLCVRVLKYVHDWLATLREFNRILAPGGRLAIEFANAHSIARFGYRGMNLHFESLSTTANLLDRTGFDVDRTQIGPAVPYLVYRGLPGGLASSLLRVDQWRATKFGALGARSIVVGARKRD